MNGRQAEPIRMRGVARLVLWDCYRFPLGRRSAPTAGSRRLGGTREKRAGRGLASFNPGEGGIMPMSALDLTGLSPYKDHGGWFLEEERGRATRTDDKRQMESVEQ